MADSSFDIFVYCVYASFWQTIVDYIEYVLGVFVTQFVTLLLWTGQQNFVAMVKIIALLLAVGKTQKRSHDGPLYKKTRTDSSSNLSAHFDFIVSSILLICFEGV